MSIYFLEMKRLGKIEYVLALYKILINQRVKFSQKKICIPKPEFYVVYNGRKNRPAIEELRLSKAFIECGMEPPLELIVKVININHPDNKEFLEKCEQLKGYKEFGDVMSDFIDRYGEKGYDLGIAYCIKHGILADFLSRHIKEVLNMLKAKYSYKDEIRVLTQEAREEGWERGLARGIEKGERVEKVSTARRMKDKDCDISFIAEMTGLTFEEIEQL